MFIPLFIAILLGLVSPSANSNCSNSNGTVVTTQNANGDDGDDGTDTGETGGGPVSGENGTIKPPKP